MTDVNDLKQACLDLSKAALTLFDGLEEHGVEAPWQGNVLKGEGMEYLLAIAEIRNSWFTLSEFFARQSASRLLALGVSPATLMGMDNGVRRR